MAHFGLAKHRRTHMTHLSARYTDWHECLNSLYENPVCTDGPEASGQPLQAFARHSNIPLADKPSLVEFQDCLTLWVAKVASCGRVLSRASKSLHNGWWRSLVAHLTGGQGVAGSNPVHPTRNFEVRAYALTFLHQACTKLCPLLAPKRESASGSWGL